MVNIGNKWLSALILGAVLCFSAFNVNAEESHYYDIKRTLEFAGQITRPAVLTINRNDINLAKITAAEPVKYNLQGLFLNNGSNIFDKVTLFNDGLQNIVTEAFDNEGLVFSNKDDQPIITPTEAFLKLPKIPYALKGYLAKGEKIEVLRNNQLLISLEANDYMSYNLAEILLVPDINIIQVKHYLHNGTITELSDNFKVYGDFIPYQPPIVKPQIVKKVEPTKTSDLLVENTNIDNNDKQPLKTQTKNIKKPEKSLTKEEKLAKDIAEIESLKPKVKPPKKAETGGKTEDDDLALKQHRVITPTKADKSKAKSESETSSEGSVDNKKELLKQISDKVFVRPEFEDELVVELRVGDTILDRSFPARESDDGDIFIPLTYFTKLLSIAVDVNKNKASGWVFDKSNIFEIDLINQTGKNKTETIKLSKNAAFEEKGEIFVEIQTLSYLLPFDLEMNWRRLSIMIIASDNFPFQQKMIRRTNWKLAEVRDEIYSEQLKPKQKTEYSTFIPPSIDFNSSLNWSNQNNKFAKSDTINTAGDLLYGTLSSNLTFSDSEITRMRLNYSRIDEDGGAIAPIKATKMEMGDIRIPGISSFTSGVEAVGFRATNQKIGATSIFSNTTIEGEAPIGWDIELYRNGELVGFFDGSNGGRYVFENIGMLRNGNVFEIVKYGPHGEIEREIKNYLVPSDVVPPGKFRWDIAGGLGNASLEGQNNNKQEAAAWYAHTEYGINNFLIASFENEKSPESNTLKSALGLTTVLNKTTLRPRLFFDELNLKGIAVNSITKVGKQASLTFDGDKRFKDKEGLVEGSHLWNLKSRFNTPIGKNQAYFELRALEKLDNTIETVSEASIRTKVKTFNISQTLAYEDGIDSKWLSNSSLRSTNGVFYSPNLDLDLVKPESGDLETTLKTSFRRSTGKYIATLGITTPFNDMDKASISSGVSTKIGSGDLGISGLINYNGDASVGLSFRIGLGYDYENKKYQTMKHGVSSSGWAKVKMHLDKNGKGLQPIEGVKLRGQKDVETSKDGHAIVSGLAPGKSINLSIDRGTLDDPFLTPLEENYWVRPRAGVMESVDMIVSITGEVEGKLFMFDVEEDEEQELAGVEVLLLESGASGRVVAKVRSEFDGYYLFDGVKPGKYIVKPSDEHLKLIKAKDVEPIEITVKPGGDLVEGVDIKLPRNGLSLNGNDGSNKNNNDDEYINNSDNNDKTE